MYLYYIAKVIQVLVILHVISFFLAFIKVILYKKENVGFKQLLTRPQNENRLIPFWMQEYVKDKGKKWVTILSITIISILLLLFISIVIIIVFSIFFFDNHG